MNLSDLIHLYALYVQIVKQKGGQSTNLFKTKDFNFKNWELVDWMLSLATFFGEHLHQGFSPSCDCKVSVFFNPLHYSFCFPILEPWPLCRLLRYLLVSEVYYTILCFY
jgi:hypothetical protein